MDTVLGQLDLAGRSPDSRPPGAVCAGLAVAMAPSPDHLNDTIQGRGGVKYNAKKAFLRNG